jgi:hypothetical protein
MSNMPCGPPKGNIKDPPFAVAANDQEIGHDTAGRLYNDLPWLADPQQCFHLDASVSEGANELAHPSLHQVISPLLHVGAMTGGHFGGKPYWHGGPLVLIDTQDMQGSAAP